MKSYKKIKLIGIFIFSIILITSFILLNPTNSSSGLLSVHMIDVGQGDSILIITPNNKVILIDAGEYSFGRKVKSYLTKNHIKKVDLLIGTHPHSDHIGGLSEIINNFHIEKIIIPNKSHNSNTFENLLLTIKSNNLTISMPNINEVIEFDDDIKINFLGPLRDYGDNLNMWSIILKLDFKNQSFLFTGDIEKEGEMDLINTYDKNILQSSLLKVPHHGSNTSTTKEFLDYINPEIAIISVGDSNSYGHPNTEVIDRLKESDIFIYRTDLQGNIVILSDGIRVWSSSLPWNIEQ